MNINQTISEMRQAAEGHEREARRLRNAIAALEGKEAVAPAPIPIFVPTPVPYPYPCPTLTPIWIYDPTRYPTWTGDQIICGEAQTITGTTLPFTSTFYVGDSTGAMGAIDHTGRVGSA